MSDQNEDLLKKVAEIESVLKGHLQDHINSQKDGLLMKAIQIAYDADLQLLRILQRLHPELIGMAKFTGLLHMSETHSEFIHDKIDELLKCLPPGNTGPPPLLPPLPPKL